MIDPTYEATVTVGGVNSTYQFNAFPQPNQTLGGTSGLLSEQSFILPLTFQTPTPAQYDISGATATLYVTANGDSSFTPVVLGAGVLSDSGLLGGGTTDTATFTVAKNQIPDSLGTYGRTKAGNSKFYVILEDGDTYLEFFEGVNVFDTKFSGAGGTTPSSINPIGNDLGTVISILNTPPVSPATADAYLVGTSPTGVWLTPTDLSNNLVIFNGVDWIPLVPVDGNFVFDSNQSIQLVFDGTSWVNVSGAPFSDADALIKNDADNTKLIGFDASAITTATERTITMPDANVDLGALGDVSSSSGSSTDNNLATFDLTTGKLIQDSGVNISAVNANTAKVTNATHTGDVTGATALTLASVAITGQSTVTVDDADFVLISDTGDSGNLKKVLASDFGGGGGNFPTSTDSGDKTGAYTVLVGDENTTIVAGSATTADFTITYDVSLWTTAGSVLTIANESSFIVKLLVSNTGTMTIGGGIDKFIGPNETFTVTADTATHVRPVASA